ncbi:hypothetical protein [Mycoplasma suis]|uniref:Uncharacterized protein n=1 Tax=Mycoplasma suis (strain Illinois) TaxID=768700 RepID=F0QS16_MYCSL|nr:hypothetical protein [Mycoplasma suis]ADX98286.1 hypothetical protein MSU_0761 [Mycoplasma suis str. Illinois]
MVEEVSFTLAESWESFSKFSWVLKLTSEESPFSGLSAWSTNSVFGCELFPNTEPKPEPMPPPH